MQSSFRLGNVFGIDIGIHYTWLFVFVLVTWSLAVGFFPQEFPGWSESAYWTVGAIASLLLFVSVLVHELAQSLVAKSEGMPVKSITLFIFGGVSNIEQEATTPRDEFLMAFVGPASSAVIGLVLGGLWMLLGSIDQKVQGVLLYLAVINLLLAVFNLLPAFPLDGGRVFRAIVWWITNNMMRATQIASSVGQGFAYLMIFGGLYWAFTGNLISGIWLVFIGWFLNNAAESSYRQLLMQRTLQGLRVRDVMNPNVDTATPDMTIQDVIDNFVLPHNIRALPVVYDSQPIGIVTLNDIRHVPPDDWGIVRVNQIMTPKDRLIVLSPQDSVAQALEVLSDNDLNQLPVVDNGRLVGMVTRSHVIKVMQVREELGVRR